MAPPANSKYNSSFANLATWAAWRKAGIRISTDPGKHFSMPDYNEFLARIYEILKPFAKKGHILNEDCEMVLDLFD